MAAAVQRVAIIVGSQGALGRAVVQRFNATGWATVGVDVSLNAECAFSVATNPSDSWSERQERIVKTLRTRYPT